MFKISKLYAAAAIFALVGANINADMFDGVRRPQERAVPGGEKRPTAIPGLVEEETEGGSEIRVEPLEWLAGGTSGHRSERRNYRNNAYDNE
jgi:hypothetical protein